MTPPPGLLAVLTDEEVAAAGGRSDLVPLPHLWSMPEPDRPTAIATARRSLQARGVLDPRGRPVHGGVLADLFGLRHNPTAVLACARRTARWPMRARYVFAAAGALLVEGLDESGIHRWQLLSADRLADNLEAFLVPPGARDGHGTLSFDTGGAGRSGTGAVLRQSPGSGQPREQDPAADALSSAVVTADLVVRAAGDGMDEQHPPPLHGLFLGPRGSFRTCSIPGADGPVLLHGLAVADVGRWAASLLEATVVAQGQRADGGEGQ